MQVFLLALLLAFAAPLAAAAPIGASGQCHNADASAGGQDKVEIDTVDPTNATLPSGTGAASASLDGRRVPHHAERSIEYPHPTRREITIAPF